MCVCMCVCMSTQWGSEDIYPGGSRDQSQLVELGSKPPFPRSHPNGPMLDHLATFCHPKVLG